MDRIDYKTKVGIPVFINKTHINDINCIDNYTYHIKKEIYRYINSNEYGINIFYRTG